MLRGLVSKVNKVLQGALIFLIGIYRLFVSRFLGPNCRFYPSCSVYAQQAIRTRGAFIGCCLIILRLSKCHPLHKGGYDPVPEKKTSSR